MSVFQLMDKIKHVEKCSAFLSLCFLSLLTQKGKKLKTILQRETVIAFQDKKGLPRETTLTAISEDTELE